MTEKCAICGATENIQRHHTSYEPEIIQLLCVDCHKNVHGHGVGNGKGWTTKLFEFLKSEAEILFKEGATNREVAKACDISYATSSHWRKKLGLGSPIHLPKAPKTDEEIEQGILKTIHNRGIYGIRAYLTYLHDQKIIKRDTAKARGIKTETEIRVIDRMLEGKI